jgi:uncharacterized membrane protein required for colicin V production
MNQIDIILVLIIFICFSIGWKIRGIYLIFLPIAFFAGIILANITHPVFAKLFFKSITTETKKILISYLVSFAFFASIIIICGLIIAKFFDSLNLTVFDKLLGGLILVIIIIIPVYFLINFLSFNNLFGFKDASKTSLLYPLLNKLIIFLFKSSIFKNIKIHLLTFFSKKIII